MALSELDDNNVAYMLLFMYLYCKNDNINNKEHLAKS